MKKEIIGSCEIWHGDCRDIIPALDDVDHIITDPPYDIEAHTPNRRAKHGKLQHDQDLDFDPLDPSFRLWICQQAAAMTRGWFIAFCQFESGGAWRDDIELSGIRYKSPMAWIKPDSAPKFNGQDSAIAFENMVKGWCGTGPSKWNGGGGRGVYTCNTNSKNRTGLHDTEKPLNLMRELILLFTDHGQLILDPFAGVGTTAVTCQTLGRRCIAIEQHEKYFDVICRRIEDAMKYQDFFVPHVKMEQTKMELTQNDC